jgi:hypothetical protein
MFSKALAVSKSSTMELKSFNSFNKLSNLEEKPYIKGEYSSPSSLVDNLKKLQDDMINNCDPKIFNEICNLVKTKTEIPIENLNLRNPDHLKIIEQVYNPENLQSLLQKSKPDSILSSEAHKNYQNSNTSKSTLPRYDDHSSRKSDSAGFTTIKKEHIEYPKYPSAMTSSPMNTKNMGLFASPKPGTKYEDFFNDENANPNTYTKAEYTDNFLYHSPVPQKKIKNNFAVSPNMLAMEDMKSDQKQRSGQKLGGDWFKPAKTSAFQSYGKDIFNSNSIFYSPINVKYESPSK